MNKKIRFLVMVILAFVAICPAKSKDKNNSARFTISGYVKDAENGESLIGATVYIQELKTGTVTNVYGFYSISLQAGKYNVTYSYTGYESHQKQLDLQAGVSINVELAVEKKKIEEVVITSERVDANVKKAEMSVAKLDMKTIKQIPALMGEVDVIKVIQMLPGVLPTSEGSSGFSVRGGGSDQNLILLDEATVYNASHLMGFFSVFNSDAIKDIAVYKGNEPAEYGGRLSSALDIKMNDGNDKKIGVSGGIGLISSRLTVEGPLISDKGSFIVSARRTYADLFLKLSKDTTLNQAQLYFYDLNAKANYKLDEKNRIFLSGYFGKDVLGLGNTFGINWGNSTATLRWNHLFSDRLFSNTSFIFSNYDYRINGSNELLLYCFPN